MKRERGFLDGPLLWLIVGVAALVALAGLVGAWKSYTNGIDKKGYERGKAEVMALWREEALKADAEAREQRKGLQLAVDLEVGERQDAEAKAGIYFAKWQREKEYAKRQGLVDCKPAADGKPADVRFTRVFVTAYDAAWTDADGKPVFADSGGPAQAPATAGAAVSVYGPGDLLDVHGINAERHSACIRDYNALIDTVIKLKTEWELR